MDRKEFHGKRPLCFSTITVSECQILLLFLLIWCTYKKVFRSTVAEFSTWCKLCVLYFESKIIGPGCKSAFVPKSKIGRFIKLSTYFWIHKFLSCFFLLYHHEKQSKFIGYLAWIGLNLYDYHGFQLNIIPAQTYATQCIFYL